MPKDTPDIHVVVHPPERQFGRSRAPVQVCVGCCCCCCCLHSVGAIIGAVVLPKMSAQSPESFRPPLAGWDENAHEPRPLALPGPGPEAITPDRAAVTSQRQPINSPPAESLGSPDDDHDVSVVASSHSAGSLFWWSVLVLAVIGLVAFPIAYGVNSCGAAVLILALVFPAIQFGAALVTAVILALSPRPDKEYQYRQLGEIVGGTVLGTVVGLIVMFLLFVACTR
jgi:hypothetical protein